jgi:hypothetical protein
MLGIKFTKRIIIGLVLIYLAGLGWAAEFAIPFLHLQHKTATFTVVLIAAELLFISGVAILGKPVYLELKDRLIKLIQSQNKK